MGKFLLPASILFSALIVAGAWVYTAQLKYGAAQSGLANAAALQEEKAVQQGGAAAVPEEAVLPPEGLVLPVRFGDLGKKMAEAGVIDVAKVEALYAARGGLQEDDRKLLTAEDNDRIRITPENSGFLLNVFWALGLSTKNEILEKGPMQDPAYGGAGNFASTGGWTLAKGDAMDHYSRHPFVVLTSEQQALVDKVSRGIFRPCCGNSVYFPDCNHGMAMLGLLELMASQGVSEEDMYRAALQVNAYWFPDTYQTIAQYKALQGTPWEKVDPKEVLGEEYSSSSGYRRIRGLVTPPAAKKGGGGGGCGV